jgi:hypothetical protein
MISVVPTENEIITEICLPSCGTADLKDAKALLDELP